MEAMLTELSVFLKKRVPGYERLPKVVNYSIPDYVGGFKWCRNFFSQSSNPYTYIKKALVSCFGVSNVIITPLSPS
jgi:hypothetical protein